MRHWDQISLRGRPLPPLGRRAGLTPPGHVALLEQAAPLRDIPSQHGPTHVDLIPGKALISAAIQAMIGFEMPNDRLDMRMEPL